MKVVTSLGLLLMSSAAYADGWLVAEAPAAIAVSDAQAGVFRPGAMPAIGAYADNGWFALGIRLRAGVLRDGSAPGKHLADPGLGGLATASFAARVHAKGAWFEGALGGGLTGSDLVPAVEVGIGWAFDVSKSMEMGPSIRFARVRSYHEMDTLGNADLVLAGIDMRFGREHAKHPMRTRAIEPAPIATPTIEIAAPAIAIDRDDDRIVDSEPWTPPAITIIDDRIILDEHVLFELERARVKSNGKLVIAAIAKLWSEHPEWKGMTIEGHADVRGSDDFNNELSQRRADHVRDVMLAAGVPADKITAHGFGRSHPRDPGTTEDCHQRNRRVEFVIERRVEEIK
jgi:outer membrane protein OmpA-like peptidoglycan-associated protein